MGGETGQTVQEQGGRGEGVERGKADKEEEEGPRRRGEGVERGKADKEDEEEGRHTSTKKPFCLK
jgi:hypothetical protein